MEFTNKELKEILLQIVNTIDITDDINVAGKTVDLSINNRLDEYQFTILFDFNNKSDYMPVLKADIDEYTKRIS